MLNAKHCHHSGCKVSNYFRTHGHLLHFYFPLYKNNSTRCLGCRCMTYFVHSFISPLQLTNYINLCAYEKTFTSLEWEIIFTLPCRGPHCRQICRDLCELRACDPCLRGVDHDLYHASGRRHRLSTFFYLYPSSRHILLSAHR